MTVLLSRIYKSMRKKSKMVGLMTRNWCYFVSYQHQPVIVV